jgi:hypothetical protein
MMMIMMVVVVVDDGKNPKPTHSEHERFLQNPFQLTVHQSPYRSP